MAKLIIGSRGSGKTQRMIEMANQVEKGSEGHVFFIKKSHRDTYSLSFNVRVVCMDDYDLITNPDKFIGFIDGMTSANHDIQAIFIDGICKYAGITPDNVEAVINDLNSIAKKCNLEFYISTSATEEEVAGYADCEVLA